MLCEDTVDEIFQFLPTNVQIIVNDIYPFIPSLHKRRNLLLYQIRNCRCEICGKISKKNTFTVLCLECYEHIFIESTVI